MSDEQEDKIEETFIKTLGAKYPMVKIDASSTKDYGIRFYPSYYCIAPDGTVFSVPDDRCPSEAQIEELLQSVTLVPKLPDDSRYAPIARMWENKDHDKLRDYLEKMLAQENLDADMRAVFETQQAELTKRAEKQLERVASYAAGPDYFAAEQKLETIEKDWKGFAAADKAEEVLKQFKKDSDIKKEIKAGKELAKLYEKYDASSMVQARKLNEALQKFVKRYEGTHAAEQAKQKLGG